MESIVPVQLAKITERLIKRQMTLWERSGKTEGAVPSFPCPMARRASVILNLPISAAANGVTAVLTVSLTEFSV